MKRFAPLIMIHVSATALVQAKEVTFLKLLDEMTDLQRLTTWPDPAYTTKQASSYDRASTGPGEDSWFANGDAGHFVRVEQHNGREEFVLLDTQGPGVVLRIWSARPSGTMRFYLDGQDTPELEVPMQDLLGGQYKCIRGPLAGVRSRGYNLYFPIPYERHCKITTDVGGYHYHVNYRTYERATRVERFRESFLKDYRKQIRDVTLKLDEAIARTCADRFGPLNDTSPAFTFAGGAAAPYIIKTDTQDKPGVLSLMKTVIKSRNLPETLRMLLLDITFDGEKTVSCPIGDFYGIAGRIESYASIAMGVNVKGPHCVEMWSLWPMPYQKHAELRITPIQTPDKSTIEIRHLAHWSARDWSPESMYFHAGWRMTKDIPSRPFTDWTHLECDGRGRYVGGMLHMINGHRGWWGEGDEKIYVDGETFPSHFGTGSEDYYGYAWCDPERFIHPYHSQVLCDGPGVYGNTVLNRFHIIDDIPFTTSFRFDMENWHQIPDTRTTRAAVSYWYAQPGGTDFFEPLSKDNVEYIPVPTYVPYREPGVIEGESLRVKAMAAGETRIMDRGESYSGEKELWWLGGRPGDAMTLQFDAPTDGRYRVIARLSKGHDFAIVSVFVNGRQVIDQRDMYEPLWFARMPEEDFGVFELTQNDNQLNIRVVGRNDKAQDHYSFGIDYLKLQPQ